MDRDLPALSQRHRPVSPSDDVDDNSRHRSLDTLSAQSSDANAFTPPDFYRERLPPILDRLARPHHHQNASIVTSEQPGDDVAENRSPAGMVTTGYSYRPPESGMYSTPVTRPAEPYKHEVSSTHQAAHQQASDNLASPSQPQTSSDLNDSSGTYRIKRPRVSLACLFCRNRKSRCDGIRPTCKTCAHMKLDCKWPESDLRRAKPHDRPPPAEKSAKKYDHGSAVSPSATADTSRTVESLSNRASSSTLQMKPSESSIRPIPSGMAHGLLRPEIDHYGSPQASRHRSLNPSDLHESTRSFFEDRYTSNLLSTSDPNRGAATPSASAYRQTGETLLPRSESDQIDRLAYRQPRRAEHRTHLPSQAASQCRARAAQIAILARPASDAQRRAMEETLAREASLQNLVNSAGPDERLDIAFSSNWDALGGLPATGYRPFMDIVAGILGIIEVKMTNDADSVHTPLRNSRLHVFRLLNAAHSVPDLRHCSIALDLTSSDERELRRNSTSYNALGYPIPLDRLKFPLDGSALRVLTDLKIKSAEARERSRMYRRSPIHSASDEHDTIVPTSHRDLKPPRAVIEEFFQAFHQQVGEQMPGLDFDLIGERIRDGTVSSLLANAICCIGACIYEHAGKRLPLPEALSSEDYLRHSRALIGSALGKENLENVLALGVIGIRDILMGLWTSAATIVSSAMRLCIQLDLHRAQSLPPTPSTAHELDGSTLFWMIYSLDRITALSTAKPTTIKDRDIDVAFPPTMRKSEPSIFSALVRQLHHAGGLAEIQSAAGRSADIERERAAERDLLVIEENLVGHYESLPTSLRLNAANLRRAHELGQGLSFLQLHLTHYSVLIRRFLMSRSVMTDADHELMRTAALEIGQICVLSNAMDGKAMAGSPLASTALFLAGCVAIADIEALEEQDERQTNRRKLGASAQISTPQNIASQLKAARSTLANVVGTLERQAWIWPAPRANLEILTEQSSQVSTACPVSESALLALIDQIEAVQVIVRRPDSPGVKSEARDTPLIKVQRETDLEELLATFPQMY